LSQHRKVDAFTDAHAIVRASRARMAPARRRFAGILVDVFYDHFLALHWADYADQPLEAFAREVYALLRTREAILPERLRRIAPLMAQFDWLTSYRRVEAVHVALDRMGERLKRGNALLGAGAELTANYAGLEADFRAFFPEVVRFAREDLAPQ